MRAGRARPGLTGRDLRRWVTEWYDDLNQRLAAEDYGTPADDQEDPGT
jgi:hypothetical protein